VPCSFDTFSFFRRCTRMKMGQEFIINRIQAPPRRNPKRTGTIPPRKGLLCSECSIAGANKDQKLAAIITPAANPSIPSRIFLLTSLKKNTRPAPAAVIPQVKRPAAKACSTGLQPSKNSNITLEEMMAYLGFFIPSGGWALTILTPK